MCVCVYECQSWQQPLDVSIMSNGKVGSDRGRWQPWGSSIVMLSEECGIWLRFWSYLPMISLWITGYLGSVRCRDARWAGQLSAIHLSYRTNGRDQPALPEYSPLYSRQRSVCGTFHSIHWYASLMLDGVETAVSNSSRVTANPDWWQYTQSGGTAP